MSMELLYKLIELLACCIDGFCSVIFLYILCGKKRNISNTKMVFTLSISGILLTALPYVIEDMQYQIVFLVLIPFFYGLVVLEQSAGKKIIFVFVWNVILMVSNLFVVYGIPLLFGIKRSLIIEAGTVPRILFLVIHKLLLITLIFILVSYNKKYRFDYRQWIITGIQFISVLFIGAVFVDLYIDNSFSDSSSVKVVVIALVLSVMCIVVCICQHMLNVQNEYKLENEKLKTYYAEEERNIERVEEMYKNASILRHDFKHYAVLLKSMLHKKQYVEMKDIIESMIEEHASEIIVFYTTNNSLNAVMNNKASICKNDDIDFQVLISCAIPEKNTINICVILSNLLDNAIGAVRNETHKYIKVHINKGGNMLNLSVVNNVSRPVLQDNPGLETTKLDKQVHGFGIKSIDKRVKEMDGVCIRKEEQGEFKTIIRIPLEEK